MKTRPSDDANLIREIVQGQSEALAELYDRYRRLTFSVALAIVGDALTAAEVVLDVFVQVWRRAATYRPEQAQVSTWLTAITRHRAIDVLRQQGARPESRSVGWDQAGDQAASGLRDLEESAELSLQRQRVRTALAGLPASQRDVLALAYFHGYTHQQIAKSLGQPLGTVKTRLRLAMQKLRQALGPDPASGDKSAGRADAYRNNEEKGPSDAREETRH
jgi:RNA polymerase sigma-70 factor (ECF subfamily)